MNAARVNEHPWATNEKSGGSCPPRSAATSGRLVLAAQFLEAIARGMSRVAGAALEPHAGSNDGDTAIELLSEVVTRSVRVWFWEANKGWETVLAMALQVFEAWSTLR